jgi:hypothetical protein
MDKSETVGVTVMVEDAHRGDMAKVARGLKAKGFVLQHTLQEIGILTGSAPAESVHALSAVPGVSAVEKNRTDYRPQ